jgi:hypothetical protein
MMKYTLITKTGKVLVFTVKAAGEIYQQAYGGTLYTPQDLAWESLRKKFESTPAMMDVLIRMKDK